MTDLPAFSTFDLSLADGIATIHLNRGAKRNAMVPAFWTELPAAIAAVDAAPEARVVLITAEGPHFTAGLDLAAFSGILGTGADGCQARRREALRRTILRMQDAFTALDKCRVPVIAAIQGGCIGGGVDMVSACDLRYATDDAFFVIKEIDLGMTADVGTLQRLPKLIPDAVVREMAYTGRQMLAPEALTRGLINATFHDADALHGEARAIAKTIAEKSPLAVEGTKEMIRYVRDRPVDDALNYMATWNAALLIGEDMPEAMAAGMQSRAPKFADRLADLGIL